MGMTNESDHLFTWHNVLVSTTMVGKDLASRVVFHAFASGGEAQMALKGEHDLPPFPLRMPSDNEFLEMSGGFAGPFPFLAIYHPPGPVTPLCALETLLLETSGRFVPVESDDLAWPIAKESFAINGCLPRPLAERRLVSFDLDAPPEFDLNTVGDLMTVREEVALRWLGPEKLRRIRQGAFATMQPIRPEGTRGMPLTQLSLPPSILQVLAHLGATTVHGALAADRARLTRLLSPRDLHTFDKAVRTARAASTRELALPSSGRPENVLDFPIPSWAAAIPIANLDLPAATKAVLDDLKFSHVRDLKNFPAQPLLNRGLRQEALNELRQTISEFDASPRTRIVSLKIATERPPVAANPPPAPKPEGPMALQGMTHLDERTLDTRISQLRIPQRILHICNGLGAKQIRDLASIPAKKMNARGLTTMGLSTLRKAIENAQGVQTQVVKVKAKPAPDQRVAILDRGLVPAYIAGSSIDTLGLDPQLISALRKIGVLTVWDLGTVPWSDFATEIDRPMSQIKIIRRRLQELAVSPSPEPETERKASHTTSPSRALPSLHDAMGDVALDRIDTPPNVRALLSRHGYETVGALMEAPPGKLAEIVDDGFPALCSGLSNFQKANAPYLEGYDPFLPETPTMGRFGPLPTLADLVETALQDLDERSERILRMRFCLEGSWTLRGVARELGLTGERIRQIETKAVRKIQDRWMWPALFSSCVAAAYASGKTPVADFAGRGWATGLSDESLSACIRLLGPDDLKARKVKGGLSLQPQEDLPRDTRNAIERRFAECDPRLTRSDAKSEMLKGIDVRGAADFADGLLESWEVTATLIRAKYDLGGHNAALDTLLSRSLGSMDRSEIEIGLLAAGVKTNDNVDAALAACAVRLGNGKLISQRSLPDPETRRQIVDCVVQVIHEIGPSTSETILKRLLSDGNPLVRNMDSGFLNGTIKADGRMFKAGSKAWSVEKGAPNLGERLTTAVQAFLTERGRPSKASVIRRHLRKGHPDVAALQLREDGDLMMVRPRVWCLRSWPDEIKSLPDTIEKEPGKPRLLSTSAIPGASLVAGLSPTKRLALVSKAMMACLENAPPEGIGSTEAFHLLAEAGYEPKMSTLISFFNRNGIRIGDVRSYRWKAKPSESEPGTKPAKRTRSKPQ